VSLISRYNIKMLNLTHDWLEVYLPHSLKKIDRVTFGRARFPTASLLPRSCFAARPAYWPARTAHASSHASIVPCLVS
jgi:hypothetical protein